MGIKSPQKTKKIKNEKKKYIEVAYDFKSKG
jgi:hypothetical protein